MSSAAVANAVTESINAGDYEYKFRAKRRTFPREKITEADSVVVSVFSGPRTSERLTRGTWESEFTVYVVVQRKLPSESRETTGEADKLTELVEAIERHLEANESLGSYELQRYDDSTDRLPFAIELIRDTGMFSAMFGLVYAS